MRWIFAQDTPVKAVAKVWRERELGVSDPSRPAGVLLFTGRTDLGKTELTRVLARCDGGESAMPAILRMSEFKDRSAVSRLTRAASGLVGFVDGAPTIEECENKDIVVFNEIDKADPIIYDVMMQILEEGEITHSNGKKMRFKGQLMIVTTNAVADDEISDDELNDQDEHRERIRAALCEAKSRETGVALFRPEFIGRIDEVYVCKRLDPGVALKIMRKELEKIDRDYQERGVSLAEDDTTLQPIIEKHYVPSQGGGSPRQIMKKRIRPLVTDYSYITVDAVQPVFATGDWVVSLNGAMTLQYNQSDQTFVPTANDDARLASAGFKIAYHSSTIAAFLAPTVTCVESNSEISLLPTDFWQTGGQANVSAQLPVGNNLVFNGVWQVSSALIIVVAQKAGTQSQRTSQSIQRSRII